MVNARLSAPAVHSLTAGATHGAMSMCCAHAWVVPWSGLLASSCAYGCTHRCVISSFAVSGEGTALASSSVEQERAYWEVRVLKPGAIRVGVSQLQAKQALASALQAAGPLSWSVDAAVGARAGGGGSSGGGGGCKEDDVVGVAFDQSEKPVVRFTLNGEPQPAWTLQGVKGTVYPAVSVGDGAICDCCFSSGLFDYTPPDRHTAIIARYGASDRSIRCPGS